MLLCSGAVRLHKARLNISHSNLTENLAYRHGGGMYAGAVTDDRSVDSTIRIVDCTLKNNTAQANGGEGLLRQHAGWLTGLWLIISHSMAYGSRSTASAQHEPHALRADHQAA